MDEPIKCNEVREITSWSDFKALDVASADCTNDSIEWQDWLDALNDLYKKAGWSAPGQVLTTQTGEECWRDWFDDGYSAREALWEDMNCE